MSSIAWIARGIVVAGLLGSAALFFAFQPSPSEDPISGTTSPPDSDVAGASVTAGEDGDPPTARATPPERDVTSGAFRPAERPASPDQPAEPDVRIGALETNRALRDVTPSGVTPAPDIAWPVERAPGVAPPEAPQRPPEPARFFRVGVVDAGTIATQRGYTVDLSGITALDADATCADGRGADWPCGNAARHSLMRLIRARAVDCDITPETLASLVEAGLQVRAVCSVSGYEINHWLVARGWATANAQAEARYHDAEAEARAQGLGQWRRDGREP